MEQSSKSAANLMELTYWSYNMSSVSFTICLFLATTLICIVAVVYADKATVNMREMKKERCLLIANKNQQDDRCKQ